MCINIKESILLFSSIIRQISNNHEAKSSITAKTKNHHNRQLLRRKNHPSQSISL